MRSYEDGEFDAQEKESPNSEATLDYLHGYIDCLESEIEEMVSLWWSAQIAMKQKDSAAAEERYETLKELVEQGE